MNQKASGDDSNYFDKVSSSSIGDSENKEGDESAVDNGVVENCEKHHDKRQQVERDREIEHISDDLAQEEKDQLNETKSSEDEE